MQLFAQDSIVYYLNNTVIGRTLFDGDFENHYNSKDSILYSCEKLGETWYYYRADTVYQKIEWINNGHTYYRLQNGEWIKGIECVVYDVATFLDVDNTGITITSNNNVITINAKYVMQEVKVFDIEGKLLNVVHPFSTSAQLRFAVKSVVILVIDNKVFKHVVE